MKTKSTLFKLVLLAVGAFIFALPFLALHAQSPAPAIPILAQAETPAAPAPAPETLPDLTAIATSSPWFVQALAWIGALNILFVFGGDLVHKFVLATPTDKDDRFVAAVEKSKVWGGIVYVLKLIPRLLGARLKPGA